MPNHVFLVVSGSSQVVGGVSTHVRALDAALTNTEWSTTVESPGTFFARRHRLKSGEIAHFHVSHPTGGRLILLVAMLALVGVGRCVLTFHHGPSAGRYRASAVDRFVLSRLFRRLGAVVALTPAFANFVLQTTPAARVVISSSWMGAPSVQSSIDLPEPHRNVGTSAKRWTVMSGYETSLYRYEGGIAALAGANMPNCGLRICTYGPKDDNYLATVLSAAEAESVSVEWYRDCDGGQFASLLAASAVYLRNTSGDSYGLAVAEALLTGLHVIATDVCDRPSGVTVVGVDDRFGLQAAVAEALSAPPSKGRSDVELNESAATSLCAVLTAYEWALRSSHHSTPNRRTIDGALPGANHRDSS